MHTQNLVGELREEFLTRYGDHCIPIANARSIAQAVRDKADAADRKSMEVYGAEVGKYNPDVDTDAVSASASAPTEVANALEAGAAAAAETSAAEEEEDVISEEPPVVQKSKKEDPTLSAEELAQLADEKALSLPELTIAGQRFVRLRDILPDAPPRGQFNVERVRGSQYFFS